MQEIKVLLINHYAGSKIHGMEYRPYYLAKEWKKEKVETMIVASSFSHVRQKQPSFKGIVKTEEIDGIIYFWIKANKYKGNGVQRFINIITFIMFLCCYSKKIAKIFKPDIVIASSTYPLDIFPAKLIAKKGNAKLIFEVHDLWPLSPMVLGNMSKWHPFIFIMQIAENYAYKSADKVVSILPLAKDYMVGHGMKEEKFVHIPNGINIEEWTNDIGSLPDEHRIKINDLKGKEKFIVCYAGAHGRANGLESFVESAKYLKEKKIHLVLVGDGPEKKQLIYYAAENKLTNVSFLAPIPKNSIPSLLREMDVLFFSLKDCELFKYGISPNKLFDYMMAGKPIIAAVKAGNDLISKANCGITVPPGDIYAYVNAIEQMVFLDDKKREELGENGKKYVMLNHDYKKIAQDFSNLIKRLY